MNRDRFSEPVRISPERQAGGAGERLTSIMGDLTRRLCVVSRILPMSDDPVRTRVSTPDGELTFQEYFVRERCEPAVTGLRFCGAERDSQIAPTAGLPVRLCDTLMRSLEDRERVARCALSLAEDLA